MSFSPLSALDFQHCLVKFLPKSGCITAAGEKGKVADSEFPRVTTHLSLHCTDETSYEAGIKVQIHSQNEPPFIDQLGFGVAPGFQTFVSCQQQLVPNVRPSSPKCPLFSFLFFFSCSASCFLLLFCFSQNPLPQGLITPESQSKI